MPLSKPEVLRLLQKGVRQDRVVEVVKELGIDFKVTPEVMTELTGAGAGAALIAELMALRPDGASAADRPPTPPSAPTPAPASPAGGAAQDTPSPPPGTPSAPSASPAMPTVGAEVASAILPPPEPPPVPPDPLARRPQIVMPAIPAPPPVPPPPATPVVASSAPSPPPAPSPVPVSSDPPTPAPVPPVLDPASSPAAAPAPRVGARLAAPTPPPAPPAAEPNRWELVKPLLDKAQALANDGDLRGAQELVAKALEIDPGEPEVWKVFKGIEHDVLVRAEGFLSDGQVRRALREFQTIITKNPESAAGHAGMGSALVQLKSYAEAVAALERALALDPGNARYRQTLTRARDLQKTSKTLERTGQENLQRMLGDQPGKRQP